jgi:hypothetical protein
MPNDSPLRSKICAKYEEAERNANMDLSLGVNERTDALSSGHISLPKTINIEPLALPLWQSAIAAKRAIC